VQGGGAHGAFAWGVLDALLEQGARIDTIGGVSSGAILSTMLVQGLVRAGPAGARGEMRRLWRRISHAHSLSPFQHGPLQRWLWGWDLSVSPLWQGMEAAMRLFSPAQLNPFGHNPLRPVLDDLLDPRLLAHELAPRLLVAATDRGLSAVRFGETVAELEQALKAEFHAAAFVRDDKGLREYVEPLLAAIRGENTTVDLPLDIRATAFQKKVWDALRQIPCGETRSYREVAREIGDPTAVRAVARACATNPVALAVPCHRVVRSDGAISGYRWGVERKKKLLERERYAG
jgi:O-6-methylguanine DNA methyltransferase